MAAKKGEMREPVRFIIAIAIFMLVIGITYYLMQRMLK